MAVDVEQLRADWYKASEKQKHHDAIRALLELEKAEPNEPRWSQRLGETYRRIGEKTESAAAFVRAFERYLTKGLLPQAVAMEKIVNSIDPARGSLLAKSIEPGQKPPLPFTRQEFRSSPHIAVDTEKSAPIKPPPLPKQAAPKPARSGQYNAAQVPQVPPPPVAAAQSSEVPSGGKEPKPFEVQKEPSVEVVVPTSAIPDEAPAPARKPPPVPPARRPPPPLPTALKVSKPAPLAPAKDVKEDEVRFDDAPESSVEILLVEFLRNPSSIEVTIEEEEDDDDVPPTRPIAPEEMGAANPSDAYASLAATRLFAALSREAIVALADAAEVVEFVPGAMIIVRDERAFALYSIIEGSARVSVPGTPAIQLVEGDIFGESCLLDEGTRQADVRAETHLMTLRIEKSKLETVTKSYPEIGDALFDLLARRLITNLLHTSKLFEAFEPDARLDLAQHFEVRRAAAGTVLAQRGRKSDGLYIILSGNLMATPEAGSGAAFRIARGTAFGQASLLGTAAEESILAISEAVLLRLSALGFAQLAAVYPPVLAHLAETAHDPLPMSIRGG